MFNNTFNLTVNTTSSTFFPSFRFFSLTQIAANTYMSGWNTTAQGILGLYNNTQVLTENPYGSMWGVSLGNVSDYLWTSYPTQTQTPYLYLGNATESEILNYLDNNSGSILTFNGTKNNQWTSFGFGNMNSWNGDGSPYEGWIVPITAESYSIQNVKFAYDYTGIGLNWNLYLQLINLM